MDHNKLWKILQEMGISDHLTCLLRICMQVRKQQNWTWNRGLIPNWERSTSRLYIVTHLTYTQSTSWEMPGWRKHKLESRLLGEISITSDMQMIPPLWQTKRGTKEPLDESERGEWKAGLKLNIQKTKIMTSGPITSWEIDGETVEIVSDFIFWGLQNHCRW